MRPALLRAWRTAGALALAVLVSGHVGTDDVFFAGAAGPWSVRVSVRQPGVIPGLADISVRVAEPGVERVLVTARQSREGGGEAPPADVAEPVRGETGLFSAQLWLMVRGPHEVLVTVEGDAGAGIARVPVEARATKQLEMSRGLEVFVFAGGLFLVVGLLTLVGTASRESVLPAGLAPESADRGRARRATAVAAVALAAVLFGGWTWIQAEARAHRARLDRPWAAESSVAAAGAGRVLELAITEPLWANRNDADWRARNNRYRRADLIPDHGKIMHMFVVREPDLDAFAHIHPERVSDNRFAVAFPPLPGGRYRVYADITHEDGSARTLYVTADVPAAADGPSAGEGDAAPGGFPLPDRDDAWWSAGAFSGSEPEPGEAVARLAAGTVMRWVNADDALIAGAEADLVFRVEDAAGAIVPLDPYMGMRGHAMLNRAEGDVFIHLHPTGMVSMAAQAALNAAGSGMSGMGDAMDMAAAASEMAGADGTVRFPLVIPRAGRYRIWVQVRQGENVLTGSFEAEVVERSR